MIGATTPAELQQRIEEYTKTNKIAQENLTSYLRLAEPVKGADGESHQFVYVWLPPQQASNLFGSPAFFFRIAGASKNVDYTFGADPVQAYIPQLVDGHLALLPPGAKQFSMIDPETKKPTLVYRGLMGLHNDQDLHGNPNPKVGAAVYGFINQTQAIGQDGQVPFVVKSKSRADKATSRKGRKTRRLWMFVPTTWIRARAPRKRFKSKAASRLIFRCRPTSLRGKISNSAFTAGI